MGLLHWHLLLHQTLSYFYIVFLISSGKYTKSEYVKIHEFSVMSSFHIGVNNLNQIVLEIDSI